MLTNNKIKLIKSLDRKVNRTQNGVFIVEGEKMVDELLNSSFIVDEIFCLTDYAEPRQAILSKHNVSVIDTGQLNKISHLKTPNKALALVKTANQNFDAAILKNQLCIALDNIQDPGNLGTIIRTASWFGISSILCSQNTVDVYNPKVVQSTMGALFNVNVFYVDLYNQLNKLKTLGLPVYATSLTGNNVYNCNLTANGIIVMGNESGGVNSGIQNIVNQNLFIPKYSNAQNTESLNVSMATALICAEFRRRFA